MSAPEEPRITTSQLVRVFIKLRGKRSELKTAFEEEDEELKQKQRMVENELLSRAIEEKCTGFTTKVGTTYISEERHVSIVDSDEFTSFVRDTNDYLFYEQRPSLGHVTEYQKAHDGLLPPGIRMFMENRMRVRASKSKKEESNGG